MEWSEGDLVWFDPGLGHPLPGEIQEVHRAAQVIIVQALINGKVSLLIVKFLYFYFCAQNFSLSFAGIRSHGMFESHVHRRFRPANRYGYRYEYCRLDWAYD